MFVSKSGRVSGPFKGCGHGGLPMSLQNRHSVALPGSPASMTLGEQGPAELSPFVNTEDKGLNLWGRRCPLWEGDLATCTVSALTGLSTLQTRYRRTTEELPCWAGIVSSGSSSSADFNEMIACHFLLMSERLIHYTSEG